MEDVNLKVLNMIKGTNESRTLAYKNVYLISVNVNLMEGLTLTQDKNGVM